MVEQNISGTNYETVYTASGGKLGVFNGSTMQHVFVPLPGATTAEYTSSGLANYRHADWLGSDRMETDTTAHVIDNNAYAPFGEPYAQTGNGEISFTGQNKDTDWLQYDFLFRQYDPKQGRWISPDPAGFGAVNPADPQSWDRYAYAGDRPTNSVDPQGLYLAVCGYVLHGWPGEGLTWWEPVECFYEDQPILENEPVRHPQRQVPLSPKDKRRYDKLKANALRDLQNPDCMAFCTSHGIDPVALAQVLQNQQAFNGSQSTITQADAQTGITDPSQTVAQGFRRPGVKAAASLNGTDVYFRSGGFLFFPNTTINEGTIEHEAVHNYFGMEGARADDEYVQGLFGLSINAYDTTNITQALKDHHCTH